MVRVLNANHHWSVWQSSAQSTVLSVTQVRGCLTLQQELTCIANVYLLEWPYRCPGSCRILFGLAHERASCHCSMREHAYPCPGRTEAVWMQCPVLVAPCLAAPTGLNQPTFNLFSRSARGRRNDATRIDCTLVLSTNSVTGPINLPFASCNYPALVSEARTRVDTSPTDCLLFCELI